MLKMQEKIIKSQKSKDALCNSLPGIGLQNNSTKEI